MTIKILFLKQNSIINRYRLYKFKWTKYTKTWENRIARNHKKFRFRQIFFYIGRFVSENFSLHNLHKMNWQFLNFYTTKQKFQ